MTLSIVRANGMVALVVLMFSVGSRRETIEDQLSFRPPQPLPGPTASVPATSAGRAVYVPAYSRIYSCGGASERHWVGLGRTEASTSCTGGSPVKLFQSIFGGRETVGRHPETLIEMAIERAVDGTVSRLRFVPGYRKRLREPVIHAIDRVVQLVDGIPAPIPAGPDGYRSDFRLAALFASIEEMRQVFGRDRALSEYLSGTEGRGAERVTALLMARREERTILGMDLVGDQVRSDLAQVTVSFAGHHLLEPRVSEAECRRFLKRRAFDHLLALALAEIAEARVERADLERQRDLLARKLQAMKRGTLSFDRPDAGQADEAGLQAELDPVSRQLQGLGADADVLRTHLELVAKRLGEAERQVGSQEVQLCLSPMNIRLDAGDSSARQVVLQELQNARGERAIILPVASAPRDLPSREDFVSAAERYL
jgi:hypothetical protein